MGQRMQTDLPERECTDACASPSRRSFLVGGVALMTATLVLGGCGGGEDARIVTPPTFFSGDERAFVRAAIDRLIPADGLGAGATAAGVDVFIDAQLAGPFGQAAGVYMHAPFRLGAKEQGYQLPFTPAQIYRIGIQRVDEHCRAQFKTNFAGLKPDQQDQVLHDLEDGKLDFGEIPSTNFFGLLLQNAQEGFLADPIYGGNRDFAGWKLIGYPGPRYNYVAEIEQFGKPYDAPYVSLGGTQPAMCRLSDAPGGRFHGPGCTTARMPAQTHYAALSSKDGRRQWPEGTL